jgi:4-hydroxy-3-polyprenylbenzoate decarboxylase
MIHRTLAEAVADLEAAGELIRLDVPVDPHLEAGVIQRRLYAAGGPAVLMTRVRGTRFPMLANLFGSRKRIRYLFRSTLRLVEAMLTAKADPMTFLRSPRLWPKALRAAVCTQPRWVQEGPVQAQSCRLSDLPQLVSWPKDGGAYVTLPQVYSEDPGRPGLWGSNIGMYRVQISGGALEPDAEAGLHYQIHRGIGPHHARALALGRPFPVSVWVGGPPALTLAAVMPLPEGMPEILFAGALAGHRLPLVRGANGLPVPAQADFCIMGEVPAGVLKPEGPFGDHLGYYSLAHPFPVLRVYRVWHRPDAIWPFTTVGRPPQEDTEFGAFIHELTGELVPRVFPGVHEVHAVDAAGVHPLLLAIGSERYVPYAGERMPQELLTNGMALLGSTQTSLSKYVLLAAREDDPALSCHDVPRFFAHVLCRLDLSRDLHFITRTTMDTLDYSGISLNQGSKVLWAAAGDPKRTLASVLPAPGALPAGFGPARLFAPGIVVLGGPAHAQPRDTQDPAMEELCRYLAAWDVSGIPLFVVVDDVDFACRHWDNFLWVTFTRSDPATDTYGVDAQTHCKHWGCRAMVIDARLKTYHAPPLEMDPEVEKRVDALAAPGGPLYGRI